MDNVLLYGSIAGIVELLTRLRAKDYWTAATIISAALVGALYGYLGVDELNGIIDGMVSGFGVAGLIAGVGSAIDKSKSTVRQYLVK